MKDGDRALAGGELMLARGSDRGGGEALDRGRAPAPAHQAREQRYQPVPPRAQQIGPNGVQFGAGASMAESSQQGAVRGKLQQKQTTQVQDASVAKVKKRPFCWRCKCGGHSNEECHANLDCVICNKKNIHVSFKCPILKKPKPTAAFFGSGKSEFGFLQIMDDDYTSETPELTPTALVKISGGTISAEVIQSELARITRVDWKWEAIPHGKDSFLVAFPSEDEMQRMTDIDFRLKSHGGVTLTISEWQNASSIPQSYKLDEVWVHISGVPHAWRHYLVFWAIGTVVGATLDIDMLTYRKKGVIRVLVGVLDKTKLPFTTDLVFGKDGYDITYTLEDESFVPAKSIASGHSPSDRDGKKKDDDGSTDKDPENKSKKQKNLTGASASLPTSESPEAGTGPTPMQTKLSSLTVDIAKLPPMWLTPFCKKGRRSSDADRDISGGSTSSLHTATPCPAQVASHSPTVGIERSTQNCSQTKTLGDMVPRCADFAVNVVPPATYAPACSTPTPNVVLRPNRATADVREAGSIVCTGGPGHVRHEHENMLTHEPSATMQDAPHKLIPADEDSTLKAMRRAAVRNLDGPKENKKMADDTTSPLSSSVPCNMAAGYFLDYSLAPQLGYSPEAIFLGFGYSGVSVFGIGGQGVFYPGTWVAV
ncbi:hypothetical protein U9M48_040728 [Paspalum notatum var. saurae]|uniref:DUF4283 domain-containing protein n=1 Tax=Paspalum notatum var. saurae TaxID=547442 RepID=A0AAQ3UR87_PASNO